jgi:hypothetical protein
MAFVQLRVQYSMVQAWHLAGFQFSNVSRIDGLSHFMDVIHLKQVYVAGYKDAKALDGLETRLAARQQPVNEVEFVDYT